MSKRIFAATICIGFSIGASAVAQDFNRQSHTPIEVANFTRLQVIYSPRVVIPSGANFKTAVAQCPNGMWVLSGGYATDQAGGSGARHAIIFRSEIPVRSNGTAWEIEAINNAGNDVALYAMAVCAGN